MTALKRFKTRFWTV